MNMKNPNLKQYILKRKQTLEFVKKQLKEEFIGLDHIIDEVISLMYPWYLFPDTQMRPTVINLWGMTGTGKTALVKRLVEILDIMQAYLHIDIGEFGSANTSGTWLKSLFTQDLQHHHERECVICLDEFQFARTINESGAEVDRDKLRIIWELLDSGQFYYNASPSQYYISRGYKAIKLLNKCIEFGVEVEKGKVTEGYEAFAKIFRGFGFFGYNSGKKKLKANYFSSPDFIGGINSLVGDKYTSSLDIKDEIKRMGIEELVDYLYEAVNYEGSMKLMDLSKGLIFVIGNLDEAYYMSYNINPDISADDFHKSTLKITIADIKSALQHRFRNEQIARLGNNHIIYPAFNNENYRLFIVRKLEDINKTIQERFKITLDFDESIIDIIYKEGVFPTQGARPVLTTIKNLVDSYISQIVCDMIENDWQPSRITWAFQNDHYKVVFYDLVGQLIAEKTYKVNLKVHELRKSKDDDVQAHIAVHECGHAVLAALCLRIVPDLVVTRTVDNESAGFCKINFPEHIQTRELIEKHITITLGGYVAEKLIFGLDHTSTGVRQDIVQASTLANSAIKAYAMGKDPIKVAVMHAEFNDFFFHKEEHENEALALIKRCEKKAEALLANNKLLLLQMANYLTSNSRMTKEQIEEYVTEYSTEEWVKTEGFKKQEEYFQFKGLIQEELKKLKK